MRDSCGAVSVGLKSAKESQCPELTQGDRGVWVVVVGVSDMDWSWFSGLLSRMRRVV